MCNESTVRLCVYVGVFAPYVSLVHIQRLDSLRLIRKLQIEASGSSWTGCLQVNSNKAEPPVDVAPSETVTASRKQSVNYS